MQEKKSAMIDIIVTHHDEPWEICKPFFDMLAMQRNIDFDDIRVILVQDDKLKALPWATLLDKYPYRISLASIEHSGPAAARNAGLHIADAEWVMFCDIDDFFSDVVSIRGIMNVLPTDDADIIWMRSYREEKTRATKKEKDGVFVNCLSENFYFTTGKLYKLSVLREHHLRFDSGLDYEYENAFNHVALSLIPSHRVMGLTVDFLPYFKTYRENSYTQDETTIESRINHHIIRDLHLVEEYRKRDIHREFVNLIAETIFDMYYLFNSSPTIEDTDYLFDVFRNFYRKYQDDFNSISKTELEVVHDNCVNKMLGIVQNLYNCYGIEVMPPETGIENVRKWIDSLSVPAPLPSFTKPSQSRRRTPSFEARNLTKPYDGHRVVVYCGTYNTYVNMIASAKSLLAHTKVDRIYFLTEDDEFPYEIPPIIKNINVSNQQLFHEDGPNFDNVWSYMCMMRAAFPQLFPQYDRILSFDIDIVVNEDISSLWNLDLTDYYYAGVPEPCRQKTSTDPVYCNFGVILMNLDKIRADGKDQEAIDLLNTSKLGCPEQDAFNRVCAGHIMPLPPDYNYTPFSHITGEPEREIITHYAGLKYWKHFEPVRKYASMSWEQLLQPRNEPQSESKNESAMKRIVFYFGTRDFYHMMTLSLKSLLKHTYVDRVYFMIEDDFFPEPLPPFVQCVNVSDQTYFPHDGPNYVSIYSYMVLLRAALPMMFPDIPLALCIDADTLTQDDIGPVWDRDMSDSYLAAVKEYRALHGADYYNCGVMLMNFDLMRRDNIPQQAIQHLNERYYHWKEQDVLNDLCRYHILDLPSAYNLAPGITGSASDPCRVRHYIGSKVAKDKMLKDAQQYELMSWNEIVHKQQIEERKENVQ